jgi:hypothetical protein
MQCLSLYLCHSVCFLLKKFKKYWSFFPYSLVSHFRLLWFTWPWKIKLMKCELNEVFWTKYKVVTHEEVQFVCKWYKMKLNHMQISLVSTSSLVYAFKWINEDTFQIKWNSTPTSHSFWVSLKSENIFHSEGKFHSEYSEYSFKIFFYTWKFQECSKTH